MKRRGRFAAVFRRFFFGLLVFIGALSFFAAKWYIEVYGQTGFDSVLFSLFSGVGDVQSGLITAFLEEALFPAAVATVLVGGVFWFASDRRIVLRLGKTLRIPLFPLHRAVSGLLSVAFCGGCVWNAAKRVELPAYVESRQQQTSLYAAEYVDPAEVSIAFPEEKRNLIYLFLESMETTFLAREEGGALSHNVIPELTALAEENVNFSQSEGVGGSLSITGTTWTIAAMTAQTAGLPLRIPVGVDSNAYGEGTTILPYAVSLNDILHEVGYRQALMVGSRAEYGGRARYFTHHGVDAVYDVDTAKAEGYIPEDYWVWWGMEDEYLYAYAKDKIADMAADGQPFAFTMLTVDTHHVGGYHCDLCGSEYAEDYENVYACASRQLAAFLGWIQAQDFYENTTVVITGDHPSMDWEYMRRNIFSEGDYLRHVYNCFVNAAVQPADGAEKSRDFLSFDMFPTVLASIGCEIEGDRLGLGVNLFSGVPTLYETYGYDYLDAELSKSSTDYDRRFLWGLDGE